MSKQKAGVTLLKMKDLVAAAARHGHQLGPPSPTEAIVMFWLCDRANSRTGRCFPSYSCIMDDTGLSRATVAKCLANLRKWKLITWERGGRSNRYTLLSDNARDIRNGVDIHRRHLRVVHSATG